MAPPILTELASQECGDIDRLRPFQRDPVLLEKRVEPLRNALIATDRMPSATSALQRQPIRVHTPRDRGRRWPLALGHRQQQMDRGRVAASPCSSVSRIASPRANECDTPRSQKCLDVRRLRRGWIYFARGEEPQECSADTHVALLRKSAVPPARKKPLEPIEPRLDDSFAPGHGAPPLPRGVRSVHHACYVQEESFGGLSAKGQRTLLRITWFSP